MAKPQKPKDIEFEPDEWQRFERAVGVVAKSPPQPKKKKAATGKLKQEKTTMTPQELRLEFLRLAIDAGLPNMVQSFVDWVISSDSSERREPRPSTPHKRPKPLCDLQAAQLVGCEPTASTQHIGDFR